MSIREHEQVTGFLKKDDRVYSITTATEHMEADVVVCTAHSWTLSLLEQIGVQLPMKSFVHQRYVTTPASTLVNLPAVNANPHGAYFRPAAGNRLLCGIETPNRSEFIIPSLDFQMDDLTVPTELKYTLQRKLRPLLRQIDQLSWQTAHVGLIAFSIDGEPILGALPNVSGLLVGTAFHSGGFAYNPVAGLLLAEMAIGEQTSLDIRAFAPDRFEAQDVQHYLAAKATQEAAVSRRH